MTDAPKKRGRPPKVAIVDAVPDNAMTVLVDGVIFDGKGGFMPVGSKTVPVDDYARKVLKERGWAE